MTSELQVLHAVLAHQHGMVSAAQIVNAVASWSDSAQTSELLTWLQDQGWLTPEQRSTLENSAAQQVAEHGDPHQALLRLANPMLWREFIGAAPVLAAQFTFLQDSAASRSTDSARNEPSTIDERPSPLAAQTGAEATGQVSSGRFTQLRPHAQGGLGQVSIAFDADMGRQVALKEIRPDRDSQSARQRFLTEARITGCLEHPGVVPIYALGQGPHGPYYAMRFVRGRTLAEANAEHHAHPTPLGFRDLLRRFVDVCQTIAYAHSRGVIHRDLKPTNIMLGEFGETLVLDWGLAKQDKDFSTKDTAEDANANLPDVISAQSLTEPGQVLGTPAYMAPEQAAGGETSQASDIYALGAILYELLTSRRPYYDTTGRELLERVRLEAPAPPNRVAPDAPQSLEVVCLKAMHREPGQRYAAAADVAREVERWLADEPVLAYPEPWPLRARRWARRHRTLVTTSVALLGTAVLALTVGLVLLDRKQRETDTARQWAETNFQSARDAVDEMLSTVAEVDLAFVPQMEPLRRTLLERALSFQRRFLEQKQTDPGVRQEAARALSRLGMLERLLGDHASAEGHLREAVVSLEELTGESPADGNLRLELTIAYNQLGLQTLAGARHGDAETAFLRAQQLLDQVFQNPPAPPGARLERLRVANNLGLLWRQMGQRERAEKTFRTALSHFEPSDAEAADGRTFLQLQVTLHNNLGALLAEAGRDLQEAERLLRDALPIVQKLATQFPYRADFRDQQAEMTGNLGSVLLKSNRFQEAADFFRRALPLLGKLAADFPAQPELRRKKALTHHNFGICLRSLRDSSAAEDAFGEAITVGEELVDEFPLIPQYRLELAISHRELGETLFQRSSLGEAGKAYRRAVELMEKLLADNPSVPAYSEALALSLSQWGVVQAARLQMGEAEESWRRSVELLEKLAPERTADPKCRLALATNLSNLAVLGNIAKRKEMEPSQRRAIEILQGLTKDFPHNPAYQKQMTLSQLHLANLLENTSRPSEAESAYVEAVKAADKLVAELPQTPEYHHLLGIANLKWGELVFQRGDFAEALPLCRAGAKHQHLAVKAEPPNATFRAWLGPAYKGVVMTLLRLGEHREVASLAAEWPKLISDNKSTLFESASMLAQCMPLALKDRNHLEKMRAELARTYGDQAMAALRQAVAKGFRNVRQLQTEPDLESLRARRDFQDLLAELKKKAADE